MSGRASVRVLVVGVPSFRSDDAVARYFEQFLDDPAPHACGGLE